MGVKRLDVCDAKASITQYTSELAAAEPILEKGQRWTPRVVQVNLVFEFACRSKVWHGDHQCSTRFEYTIRLCQKSFWSLNPVLNHADRQVGSIEIVRAI